MTAPDLASTLFLPPTDTVRAWQERNALRPTVAWSEMINEEHASAFTVAKIARLDLLVRVRASLDTVIRDGGTFEQWKANILPELQKAGWWGVVQDKSLTGTDDAIVVNDRRLRNIYRTNIRMSMAAGRWRKYQREKDLFPYLRYLSDHYRKHPRLNHESWHGIILPVDHPAWQWLFPPNGWGCNCRVAQVSERMMRAKGWTVSEPPDPGTYIFETADRREIEVPKGVQPGFGYNPGTAHLRVVADRAAQAIHDALDAGLDGAAQAMLRGVIADSAFEQFAAMPEGAFPVAILTAPQQQQIAAQNRIVMMPAGVYRKQLGLQPERSAGHPELTIDNYRLLPDLVDRSIVIAAQGDNRLIYFGDEDGNIWKVVVRQDAGHRFPVVVSFHRSRPRNITPETRNLTVLLDRR